MKRAALVILLPILVAEVALSQESGSEAQYNRYYAKRFGTKESPLPSKLIANRCVEDLKHHVAVRHSFGSNLSHYFKVTDLLAVHGSSEHLPALREIGYGVKVAMVAEENDGLFGNRTRTNEHYYALWYQLSLAWIKIKYKAAQGDVLQKAMLAAMLNSTDFPYHSDAVSPLVKFDSPEVSRQFIKNLNDAEFRSDFDARVLMLHAKPTKGEMFALAKSHREHLKYLAFAYMANKFPDDAAGFALVSAGFMKDDYKSVRDAFDKVVSYLRWSKSAETHARVFELIDRRLLDIEALHMRGRFLKDPEGRMPPEKAAFEIVALTLIGMSVANHEYFKKILPRAKRHVKWFEVNCDDEFKKTHLPLLTSLFVAPLPNKRAEPTPKAGAARP